MGEYFGDIALVRFVLERGIGAIYFVAFLSAFFQFRPLLGERGLLPVPRYLERVGFLEAPSLFHLHYSDRFFAFVALVGLTLAALVCGGWATDGSELRALSVFLGLYVLYLSIVNVGQSFYAFGWESMLLEAGFFAAFLGPVGVEPSLVPVLALRFMLFRVELGAGLIKIRHDACWRDLTCLYYHHETQPIPGPLSRAAHRLPKAAHRAGVAFSHVVQLVAPWFLLAPRPVAGFAALVIIAHQLLLIASGNYAWLNWLTVVLGVSGLDDSFLAFVLPEAITASLASSLVARSEGVETILLMLAGATVVLGIPPTIDLTRKEQRMNYSYNPLHLVGSYGAFGSVTRTRYELVVEGTESDDPEDESAWRAYEFRGKPGDPMRHPRQFAPYHLRLDWAMWFLPFSVFVGNGGAMFRRRERWFEAFLDRLLEADRAVLSLLRVDPFEGRRPRFVRVSFYRYAFARPDEPSGSVWTREFVDEIVPPTKLTSVAQVDRLRPPTALGTLR